MLASSFLMMVGMIFSYSLSIFAVDYFDYSQFHFFLRQGVVVILAIFLMWGFAHIRPEVIFSEWKIGWWLFGIFSVLLIIMNFLPSFLVTASGGANRWIRLPGFSLSPVEFFKVGFIFFLSQSFHKKFANIQKVTFIEELKMLVPYGIVFSFFVFFIAVLQKDLGNVVLLAVILLAMLVFVDRSFKVFFFIISLAIAGFVSLIMFAPHRIGRIRSWWSSVQDTALSPFPTWIQDMFKITEFAEPYQVSNSLNAIYNGGWFGEGLAEGGLKLGFLGEVHTDFVLAGITEEIGFFGFIFIIALLFFVIFRIFRISRRIDNQVYHLFALGIALMISVSFLINAYGISGIIPIKGIAVPFLSYGGSSVLALGIALGMVLSISKELDDTDVVHLDGDDDQYYYHST
ncbi:MAG: FtsW/RodA/SpoVE family cell cycle protein [Epsilonproteobacteria bacterium]|nr:FtsW/RodA/SpoVE family cell cycle protein [Campylobacterota bacterium]